MAIALIVAAGRGERLGANRPKALVRLAGVPLLQWSVLALSRVAAIERIVVALPAGTNPPPGTEGVTGGETRSQSVRNALAAAGVGDPVLVHDAARPLLTAELARSVLDAVADADAAVAASPVTDTIKRADAQLTVSETLDRSTLWAVQTPQVFRRAALEAALAAPPEALASATDDASLVEAAGGRVVVVPAPAWNLKVTNPLDLHLAELLLAERDA
jgi:2-C-methyl-D-erythritol 4-phosphate cytidylyltransferase